MLIGYDATPAAVQQAGVGRYARELLRALLTVDPSDDYQLLCAASPSLCSAILDELPPGAARRIRRVPVRDRVVTAAWQRLRFPLPVETFTGHLDIFHGPDFVLPPSRCPSIVTIHDLSYRLFPEYGDPRLVRYLETAVPRAIERAAAVIAVSAAIAADTATAYPWAQHKIVAIPNGVRAPLTGPHRRSANRPTVLTVGTIEPRKNHLALLAAIDIVRASGFDVRLVVAGRIGWQAAEIERHLRQAVRDNKAELVLSPSDSELETLYAAATAVVLPSVYEGFGLPLLEAMARGVPVVASDVAAHREVGGEAVRYVDPHDADHIAATIAALIQDSATLKQMSAAGRERSATFSWEHTAQRTRRTYKSVVQEGLS